MIANAEQAYMEREKRINDAIALRRPDRVPIVIDFGAFTAQYAGITQEEFMTDLEKHLEANWKTNTSLAPDLASPPLFWDPYSMPLIARL